MKDNITRDVGKKASSDLELETSEGNIGRAGGDRLLRVKEAAEMLAVSVREYYRLTAGGQLPAPVKIGRATRIPLSDIQRYIEGLKQSREEGVA